MYDEHVITSFAESAMIKQQITRRKLRALQVNSVQLYKEHHAHSHIMEFQVSCPSLSQLSQVRTGARSFAWSTRGQVMALNVWGVRCFLTTGVYVDFRILILKASKKMGRPWVQAGGRAQLL